MSKRTISLLIFVGIVLATLIGAVLENVLGVPPYEEVLTAIFGEQKIAGLIFSLVLIGLIVWAMATAISKCIPKT